jgi:histidyl-tRNA synthetase
VAEDVGLETLTLATTTALRRAGIRSDSVVTGSPRKRFDRALKFEPRQVVSLKRSGGLIGVSQRGYGATKTEIDRVAEIINPVVSAV